MATTTVTVLTENTAVAGLEGEHGLSVLIETDRGAVLFDTGETDLFIRNAHRLGVDLSRVTAIVLSHGHYDHAGGMPAACRAIPNASVWLHRRATAQKFSRHDEELHQAGVPDGFIAACGDRLRYASGGDSPLLGMRLVSATISAYPLPAGNESLFVDMDGALEPDPFEDELSLAVEVGGKVMLITGCSHRGVANIVDSCGELLPGRPIEVIIGGLHTKKDNEETLSIVADRLADVPRIYAGHCTGDDAFAFLERRLGDALAPCPAGTRIVMK